MINKKNISTPKSAIRRLANWFSPYSEHPQPDQPVIFKPYKRPMYATTTSNFIDEYNKERPSKEMIEAFIEKEVHEKYREVLGVNKECIQLTNRLDELERHKKRNIAEKQSKPAAIKHEIHERNLDAINAGYSGQHHAKPKIEEFLKKNELELNVIIEDINSANEELNKLNQLVNAAIEEDPHVSHSIKESYMTAINESLDQYTDPISNLINFKEMVSNFFNLQEMLKHYALNKDQHEFELIKEDYMTARNKLLGKLKHPKYPPDTVSDVIEILKYKIFKTAAYISRQIEKYSDKKSNKSMFLKVAHHTVPGLIETGESVGIAAFGIHFGEDKIAHHALLLVALSFPDDKLEYSDRVLIQYALDETKDTLYPSALAKLETLTQGIIPSAPVVEESSKEAYNQDGMSTEKAQKEVTALAPVAAVPFANQEEIPVAEPIGGAEPSAPVVLEATPAFPIVPTTPVAQVDTLYFPVVPSDPVEIGQPEEGKTLSFP